MAGYIPVVKPESWAFPTTTMLQDSDKDIDVVTSGIQSELEYNRQSVMKISKQLDKVISQEDLSENVKTMLSEAGQIMQTLTSQSVNDNELLYAEKKITLSKLATEKALLQLERKSLLKKNEKINIRIAELQKDINLAKEQYKELQEQHQKKMADKEFLMLKVEEHKKTLLDLKGDIFSLAITDLVDSEELQKKSNSTRQMRAECAALQAEVDKYRDLPPNIAKAEVLLMQTKQEYEQLCRRLNSQINRQKKSKSARLQ